MDDVTKRTGDAVQADETRWGQRAVAGIPIVRVLWPAFVNYIFHQSPNNAGHVAFSGVIAVFPLVLFLSNAATYIGEPHTAVELARTLLGYAPPAVTEALLPAIEEALGHRSRFALGLSLLGTLWAASSGAQALRMALNRAYGIDEGLSFWKARLKVVFLTMVGGVAVVVAFSSVVVMPYIWMLLNRAVGLTATSLWLWIGTRYGIAFVVLFITYCAVYAGLPDVRQRVMSVVPGAFVGVVLWFAAAALLGWALRSAAELTPVYGSFAGVIATLIFFYVSAVTVIFGAEVNGVLRARARR